MIVYTHRFLLFVACTAAAGCANDVPGADAFRYLHVVGVTDDVSTLADAFAVGEVQNAADSSLLDGVAAGDLIGACKGAARCSCNTNQECDSGLCFESAYGKYCAAPCADDGACLASEGCLSQGVGGEFATYCVPRLPSLCAPCKSDADCKASLSVEAPQCVADGDTGSYCSRPCDDQHACPAGYGCAGTPLVCRPLTGQCVCSVWAAGHNATTTCFQTNNAGSCPAPRVCSAVGAWPSCDATAATAEACNGKDDNCDGLTDEATDAACKDADICTQDVCSGGTCQHLKNVVCGDGNCADKCGETKEVCPIDCHVCGNNFCETGESPKSCAIDCCGVGGKPAACGDGVCSGYECGESTDNCKADCTAPCGNKLCEPGESKDNCPADCAPACGNGICEPGDGGAVGCAIDCGTSCGNCTCEPGEASSCPNDCGHCGDDVCSLCSGLHEDAQSCPSDCSDLKLIGCTLTWEKFCTDASPCTADYCITGKGCIHLPQSATCTDGNACTVGDLCWNTSCEPGTPVNCDDGNACTKDKCDLILGCVNGAVAGGACNDGDACTSNDVCNGKTCGGSKIPCDDSNPCTLDSCAGGKCAHAPANAGGGCSDGNPCTTGDACSGGACSGKAVSCDDGNPCTVDSCNPSTGNCTYPALHLGYPVACGAAAGQCWASSVDCSTVTAASGWGADWFGCDSGFSPAQDPSVGGQPYCCYLPELAYECNGGIYCPECAGGTIEVPVKN